MKVFRLNEYEWWYGPDSETVIQEAMDTTKLPKDDLIDDLYFHELTDKEIDKMKILIVDGPGKDYKRPMRAELEEHLAIDAACYPQRKAGYLCGTES